jgi:hypothetical protein
VRRGQAVSVDDLVVHADRSAIGIIDAARPRLCLQKGFGWQLHRAAGEQIVGRFIDSAAR